MSFIVRGRQNKGSITVEASIIVPIVILSISAIIYMGLLLYQRTLVQSAAEIAANAGAAAWASGVCEIATGKPNGDSFEAIQLYRRLKDSNSEKRLQSIESYALSLAKRNELIRPTEAIAVATLKDYVVSRKLEVKLVKCYRLPLGSFLKRFGGSEIIEISVKAIANINEPAELVRTTDFILDIEKKLENTNPGVKNLGEKTRNTMNEIKEKLESFMN